MEQQVQHLAGGVAVIKETLYGPQHTPNHPSSPSRSRSVSPARAAEASGALLASHGMCTTPLCITPVHCLSQ